MILCLALFFKAKLGFVFDDKTISTGSPNLQNGSAKENIAGAALETENSANQFTNINTEEVAAAPTSMIKHDDYLLHLKSINSQSNQLADLKKYIESFEAKRKASGRSSEIQEIQNDIYIESLKETLKLPLGSSECGNSRQLLISQFNQKEEIGTDVDGLNMALEIFDVLCPVTKK